MDAKQKLIVSLDVLELDYALTMIDQLSPIIDYFKVGIAPFTAFGDPLLRKLNALDKKIFLDLKFHDIPNTVKNAVKAAALKNISMINVHCLGGLQMMQAAREYAAMLDLLIISHCEDKALAPNGVMHEGYWSTRLGLAPILSESESIIVSRDIQLAELTGARLHIAHVSTAKSVEIIQQAKKRGAKVTAEATPHHFTLTDETLKTYNTNIKVNPPLRSAEDVEAIKIGLKDGTIDVIATDHAPHLTAEKQKEFDFAPFGMIGLETALPLAMMQLVNQDHLTLPQLIEKLSTKPCEILKYSKGTLKIGADADIVIIDPNKKWKYTKDSIQSLSSNSTFIDWDMKSAVIHVFVDGKIKL